MSTFVLTLRRSGAVRANGDHPLAPRMARLAGGVRIGGPLKGEHVADLHVVLAGIDETGDVGQGVPGALAVAGDPSPVSWRGEVDDADDLARLRREAR